MRRRLRSTLSIWSRRIWWGMLPRKRYDFVRALADAQKSHPDLPLTPEKVGLQPYQTAEVWERLKVAMREYRTAEGGDQQRYEAGGGGDCVSGGVAGALCGGWIAAAAHDDSVQRVDGAESEWIYDGA